MYRFGCMCSILYLGHDYFFEGFLGLCLLSKKITYLCFFFVKNVIYHLKKFTYLHVIFKFCNHSKLKYCQKCLSEMSVRGIQLIAYQKSLSKMSIIKSLSESLSKKSVRNVYQKCLSKNLLEKFI